MPFEDIDWLDIQKKYLDALVSFNSPGAFSSLGAFGHSHPFEQFNLLNVGAHPSNNSFNNLPWVNAMNDWWRSVKPESPNEYQKLFGKVIEQGKNYYFLCEQFSKLAQGMAANKDKEADILGFINAQFKEMASAFLANQSNLSWPGLIDSMEQPLELMKMATSNMAHFSNDIFNKLSPEVKKQSARFLSAPGLGYGRETQDKYQELIRLWVNYQDHYQEYQRVLTDLNQQSLEVMRKKMIAMAKQDEAIKSMKQIYDLWVESNEQVYSEYVFTDDYSELNGRLINALMAFKKKHQEISEDILTAMNMPTVSAVNALEHRQYDLKKQIKMLQQELEEIKQAIKPEVDPPTKKAEKKEQPVGRKKKTVRKAKIAEPPVKTAKPKRVKKKAQKTGSLPGKKKAKKSTADNKGIIELKF